MIRVTLAERADIPALLSISNEAAARTPANFATEPELLADWGPSFDRFQASYPWLVAKEGDRVLGFARGLQHKARGAYAWAADVSVYITFDAHGRGIGSRLYERLIPTMRAQGYVTLIAGITPGNPGSERLHARFGFTRCGTFHRVGWKYGAWHDVGYWELHLAPEGEVPRPIAPVLAVWDAIEASVP